MNITSTLVNIFRSRTRSLLTMAGIAVGVFSVVLISVVGSVGTQQVSSTLVTMGVDTLLVQVAENTVSVTLTDEDIQTVKAVDGASDVMPLMAAITESQMLGRRLDTYVWGVNRSADKLISLEAKHGRLINNSDTATRSKVCVVDESFALETYGRSNIVGKKLYIFLGGKYHEFEIAGVAKSGLSSLQGMLSNIMPGFMYVPITTMQQLCGRATYDKLAVRLDSAENTDVVERVNTALNAASGTSDSYTINNLLAQKDQLNDIMGIVTVSLSLVAGISLVVSGISVMTTMMMSVGERTREIGIKKSIGARNREICAEFLLESITLALLGSFAGMGGGMLLAAAGCALLKVPLTVDAMALTASVMAAIVIGAVFGAYPAYKAASMKPVDALRG